MWRLVKYLSHLIFLNLIDRTCPSHIFDFNFLHSLIEVEIVGNQTNVAIKLSIKNLHFDPAWVITTKFYTGCSRTTFSRITDLDYLISFKFAIQYF